MKHTKLNNNYHNNEHNLTICLTILAATTAPPSPPPQHDPKEHSSGTSRESQGAGTRSRPGRSDKERSRRMIFASSTRSKLILF